MSFLLCPKENVSINFCTCPDVDTRLKAACDSEFVMFKWCRCCDRHYMRCTCIWPEFYVRSGGKELPVPEEGFRSVTGERVVPDLRER